MRKISKILLGVMLVAIAARITIDVPVGEGIPISGQSLVVLLVGWYLGPKDGALAMILYILMGGFGVPVFADGASGWGVLQKGSGGFLIGFIFGAAISGYFAIQRSTIYNNAFNAMLLGTGVILLFGLARLSQLYGFEKALEYGFFPFWPGAVIKIILGVIIILIVSKLKPKTSSF